MKQIKDLMPLATLEDLRGFCVDYELLKDRLNIARITFTSGVNAASAEFDTRTDIDRCPLCGIALNEKGVCPKCGYKKP